MSVARTIASARNVAQAALRYLSARIPKMYGYKFKVHTHTQVYPSTRSPPDGDAADKDKDNMSDDPSSSQCSARKHLFARRKRSVCAHPLVEDVCGGGGGCSSRLEWPRWETQTALLIASWGLQPLDPRNAILGIPLFDTMPLQRILFN